MTKLIVNLQGRKVLREKMRQSAPQPKLARGTAHAWLANSQYQHSHRSDFSSSHAVQLDGKSEYHLEIQIVDFRSGLRRTQYLASILTATERDGEAEEFHRQVIETFEKDLAPNHRETTIAKRVFARFYEFQKEFQKAVSLRYQIFEAASNQFGVEHPDTLGAMFDLAQSLRGAGRDSEALKMIQECQSTLALTYE